METKLLEQILSELSDINSNISSYDQYTPNFSTIEDRLQTLIGLLELIAERLSTVVEYIPSPPNLDGINNRLEKISDQIDLTNSLLSDINHNTSR